MQLGNEINAEPSDIGNQPTTDEIRPFSFSVALGQLKAGKRVARKGWNGKGMWLFLVPGSKFTVQEGLPLAAHIPVGTHVTEANPYIVELLDGLKHVFKEYGLPVYTHISPNDDN